jgi:hypothetical protein
VALAVETDEASNSNGNVLLGVDAVMRDADPVANTVEEVRREGCIHRVTALGPTIGTFLLDFRGFFHARPYDKPMMDAFFSVTIRLYTFRWASPDPRSCMPEIVQRMRRSGGVEDRY